MSWSIAVAQLAICAGAILWAYGWFRRELESPGQSGDHRQGPAGDAFALIGTPLLGFWGVSVVSAMVSREPIESLWEVRELFLFITPLIAYVAFRHPRMRRLGLLALGAGVTVAISWGLAQTIFAVRSGGFPGPYRPDGAFGHYMTYAGFLMICVPILLVLREGVIAVALRVVAISAIVVIGLTMTRSAWIGCIAALIVFGATRWVRGETDEHAIHKRRWAGYGVAIIIAVILGATLLLALAGPDALYDRGASIFSLENATNKDRLAMAATGLRLISAYPVLGVGPGLIGKVYPAWRVEWAVKENNSHLHNNVLQIAAERGLLGLALWLWMMAAFVVGAWRVLRYSGAYGEGGPEARAALAALTAFLTMGLFEYNFSDSEVLMVLLFVASLPFAASAGLALGQKPSRFAAG